MRLVLRTGLPRRMRLHRVFSPLGRHAISKNGPTRQLLTIPGESSARVERGSRRSGRGSLVPPALTCCSSILDDSRHGQWPDGDHCVSAATWQASHALHAETCAPPHTHSADADHPTAIASFVGNRKGKESDIPLPARVFPASDGLQRIRMDLFQTQKNPQNCRLFCAFLDVYRTPSNAVMVPRGATKI
jgi:hypothetical protein